MWSHNESESPSELPLQNVHPIEAFQNADPIFGYDCGWESES